jgi:hypothetical protein
MKLPLQILAFLISASLASAQVVVTDPIAHSLTRIDHAQDIAKYVQMIDNQVRQINSLTQQLQQIQAYVKAFGNPAQLLNIVGANQLISSLQQTGAGQTLTQLQRTANGLQALQYTGNGLYQGLGQSFRTPLGTQFPRLEDSYRKYGAVQDDSRNFQTVTDDVLTRRKTLRDQIAATTQKLQASTTDAAQIITQDAENRADRERQEEARREERQAQMQESVQQYGEVFRLETSPPSFQENR